MDMNPVQNGLYRSNTLFAVLLLIIVGSFGMVNKVEASHSWGSYHWARTANPFTLQLGDNLSSTWKPYLSTASLDWSQSAVLDTTIVAGLGGKSCRATSGRVEVCNRKYGNNGWLGLAQIWISGSHITKGVVKLNDTYFNKSTYNKPAWRNLVMCQEIAHTFGLDHQDEIFNNANLGSCMDYTNDPDGSIKGQADNQFPNQHDYDQLVTIYSHLDGFDTAFFSAEKGNNRVEVDLDNPSAWGKIAREDAEGRASLYERDLGRGGKIFTFVTWAE